MKNYNYINEKVTIKNRYGNQQEFEAHILDPANQHSTVNGIIWRSYDNDDNTTGSRRWFSDIYILPKKTKKWELFYSGLAKNCPIGESGLFLMLFNLESKEVQSEYNIKNAIIQAKEEINRLNEQLENAKKNYKYVLSLRKQKINKEVE